MFRVLTSFSGVISSGRGGRFVRASRSSVDLLIYETYCDDASSPEFDDEGGAFGKAAKA